MRSDGHSHTPAVGAGRSGSARVGEPSIAPPTRRRPFGQARWQAPRERRQGVGNPKQKRLSVARSEREAPLVRGRQIRARREQHEERGRSHRRPQVVVDRASSEAAHGRHDDERPLPALLPERLPGSSSRRLASPAPAPPTSCRAVRPCTTECQNIRRVGRGQMIRGKLEANLVVHTSARDSPMRRQRARPCQVYERRNPGPTAVGQLLAGHLRVDHRVEHAEYVRGVGQPACPAVDRVDQGGRS
jgi:hypothetical protein